MLKPRNPFVVLIWSFGLFILIHTTQYAGYLLASLVTGTSFESIISGQFTNHLTLFSQGIIAFVLGIPFALLVVKFLWRRPFTWLRLHFDFKLLSYGFILGIVLAAFSLLVISLLSDVHITATPGRFAADELILLAIGSLGWVMFIAFTEELIFRGMAVREWATQKGWMVASLFGGLYFGAAHVIGLLPNVDILSILLIFLAAIVGTGLFVALYVRSKSLWLPIGYHAGWNLCLNSILGVTISGQESPYGLFVIETSGPDIVTGGSFGMEASLIVMLLSIIITAFLLKYSRSAKPILLSPKLEN